MLCTNCGKDIPFVGNVCPWCNANKKHGQAIQMSAYFWGFLFAVIGGLVGSRLGFGYFVAGLLGGLVLGVIFGLIVIGKKSSASAHTRPGSSTAGDSSPSEPEIGSDLDRLASQSGRRPR